MIPRALEAEIMRLHDTEHWPLGTIATQLRVHHSTVRRVLAQAGVPAVHKTVRASLIEPYRAFITEILAKYPTLRASRLYQMVRERGYPGAPLPHPHRARATTAVQRSLSTPAHVAGRTSASRLGTLR